MRKVLPEPRKGNAIFLPYRPINQLILYLLTAFLKPGLYLPNINCLVILYREILARGQ